MQEIRSQRRSALWCNGTRTICGAWLIALNLAGPATLLRWKAVDASEKLAEPEAISECAEGPDPLYVAPTRFDRIGRVWAPVVINNRGPFRLVLDTGASRSAVNATVAAALEIPPDTNNRLLLQGTTGSRLVPSIKIESFAVGELEVHATRLPIIVDAFGGADGILGMDGLQDTRILIDFQSGTISILRSRNEPAPRGFVTVQLRVEKEDLLVTDILVGRVRAKAIIDTGGQTSIGNSALEAALTKKIRPEDIRADDIQGATLDVQRGDRVSLPPISLGELKIRGLHVTTGDMAIFERWRMTRHPTLLIGMDVLGLFRALIIDYRKRELQVRLRDDETSASSKCCSGTRDSTPWRTTRR